MIKLYFVANYGVRILSSEMFDLEGFKALKKRITISHAYRTPAESRKPKQSPYYHNISIESINDFFFERNTIIVHDNILKKTHKVN